MEAAEMPKEAVAQPRAPVTPNDCENRLEMLLFSITTAQMQETRESRTLIERKTVTTMRLRGIPKRFITIERCSLGMYLERSVPIVGKYMPDRWKGMT